MATSALEERRKRLVNRVGRHLPCNTLSMVTDFANVATKVVDNILAHPEEVKFRELRASNKTINRAIIGCHGGREFLHLLGFEKIKKNAETFYFLSEPELEHLSQAKTWLKERAEACGATAGAASGHACADTVLTILLTSGQTLEGGFYRDETIHDLYAFLQASVVNSGEELRLRVNRTPQEELGEKMLGLSLGDAKLVPRATLVVVKPSVKQDLARSTAAPSKRSEADEADMLRQVQEYSTRRRRDAAAEKVKNEVIEKFRADHAAREAPEPEDDGGVEETKGRR